MSEMTFTIKHPSDYFSISENLLIYSYKNLINSLNLLNFSEEFSIQNGNDVTSIDHIKKEKSNFLFSTNSEINKIDLNGKILLQKSINNSIVSLKSFNKVKPLFFSGSNKELTLWNELNFNKIKAKLFEDYIQNLTESNNTNNIIFSIYMKKLHIFDLNKFENAQSILLGDPLEIIYSISFLKDINLIAAGLINEIFLLDSRSSKVIKFLYSKNPYITSICQSQKSNFEIAFLNEDEFCIVDIRNNKIIKSFEFNLGNSILNYDKQGFIFSNTNPILNFIKY